MLPHTVVMMCTFEVGLVQLLDEVLFPLVMELDLLIYTEFGSIAAVFISCCLILIYRGCSRQSQQILLNQIAAFVFSNFNLVFL